MAFEEAFDIFRNSFTSSDIEGDIFYKKLYQRLATIGKKASKWLYVKGIFHFQGKFVNIWGA